MSTAAKPYHDAIRATLEAALSITNFPSILVERHNKPEIEWAACSELLLRPLVVARDGDERVLIEPSVNSVRVSIAVKKSDDVEVILAAKFMRFLQQRAENFVVLRRKPIQGYDISILITNFHLEQMVRNKIVDFIIQFVEEIDKEIKEMKLAVNGRARVVAKEFLQAFA
eukprot:ANDGO_06268.mRNA.1 Actin-related protein 2/3 complex subunit 4